MTRKSMSELPRSPECGIGLLQLVRLAVRCLHCSISLVPDPLQRIVRRNRLARRMDCRPTRTLGPDIGGLDPHRILYQFTFTRGHGSWARGGQSEEFL